MQTQKKIKRACNPSHGFGADKVQDIPILCNDQRGRASYNSTYKKLAVQCSADSFVVT
ncbi:MAG: hypothetical protein ACK5QU_00470 [Bacteroidota bacterium]